MTAATPYDTRSALLARPWTTGEVARLRHLRAAGWSHNRCAAELGRTRGSVSGQLTRLGLTRPAPPWRRPPGELLRVVAFMRAKGRGVGYMADHLGVARQMIYVTLTRLRRRSA